jgi:hypothetical protein
MIWSSGPGVVVVVTAAAVVGAWAVELGAATVVGADPAVDDDTVVETLPPHAVSRPPSPAISTATETSSHRLTVRVGRNVVSIAHLS